MKGRTRLHFMSVNIGPIYPRLDYPQAPCFWGRGAVEEENECLLVCLFLESRNSQISRREISSERQKDDKRASLQAFPTGKNGHLVAFVFRLGCLMLNVELIYFF